MEKFKNKAWYRAVKVLFIITFIITQLYAIKMVFNNFPVVYVNSIKCSDGSTFSYKSNNLSYKTYQEWGKCTEVTGYGRLEGLKSPEKVNGQKEIDYYSLLNTLGISFFAVLLNTFIFWLIKRIFFYIISGESIIKKK